MKTQQKTLTERFQWVDALHILLHSKIITQHDFWLLTGNYITLKELPSVEEDLPGNIKANLGIQRILARPNFRGIVTNKPVTVVGFLKNAGAVLGEVEGGIK
ncbi:MAG: hypothetical protein KAW47_00200 [Thermoplasmatales archaeon]|nr:hypothetical protein [Thermoplasmatales archaeon]